jgi:protein involved in polysaccharide export with SLBB domain
VRRITPIILAAVLVVPQVVRTAWGQVPPVSVDELPRLQSPTERTEDLMLRNPPPALAGPVDPNTYMVGPGDVLQLQFWGPVTRSSMITVGPEGYILLPSSGSVNVQGKMLAAVRAEVLERLKGQFSGVRMDFRLSRPRSFRVYPTGQVKSTAPLSATGANRVHDVLTVSALQDNASLRNIEIRHTDGSHETADLGLFQRTGDMSANPWLRDGDVINVPVATEFIWAQGAVARPGQFERGPRDSLLTLFRMAGDPVPAADAHRALLIRFRQPFVAESLWFGLEEVYERKTNPELRDGDRLYVYYIPQYHRQDEAAIAGEIARPGAYPIVEGRHRLTDLVSAAGGFLGTADLSTIRVFHPTRGGETDPEFERLIKLSRDQMTETEYEIFRAKLAARREDFKVDWFRLKQAPELDILLRNGDMVRVDPLVTSVRIEGEVRRPGIVEFAPRRTVQDYVRLAGGYSARANRGKIRITRAVTGQSLRARDVPSVAPGDLIWVPERPDVTVWQHLQTLIAVTAQVATVVIAVRR